MAACHRGSCSVRGSAFRCATLFAVDDDQSKLVCVSRGKPAELDSHFVRLLLFSRQRLRNHELTRTFEGSWTWQELRLCSAERCCSPPRALSRQARSRMGPPFCR